MAARSCGGFSSWPWNPGSGGLVWGSETSLSRCPNVYPPHVGAGPAHSASAPLLPVWMDVVSSVSWLSGFHSTASLTVPSADGSVFRLSLRCGCAKGPRLPAPPSRRALCLFLGCVCSLSACSSSSRLPDTSPPSGVWFARISPHSVCCLFTRGTAPSCTQTARVAPKLCGLMCVCCLWSPGPRVSRRRGHGQACLVRLWFCVFF